jgi:glycosyltransferase involved in cell wall biosynthesis
VKTLQLGMGWFPEQAGGLNRFYYDCMRYMPQVGVEIHGLVAGSVGILQGSNSQIEAFAPLNSPLLQRWHGVRQVANRLLTDEEYPLVVSHFALYTFPLLDRLGERPLVMHFHGPWALEGRVEVGKTIANWFKWALEQRVYRRAVSFIVLSEAFRNILHQKYGVPWERIHVIPAGVDAERFDTTLLCSEARANLGWPQDRRIILTVRRLVHRMGLENLIAAADKVRKGYPDVLLLIAGKGVLSSTLQAQIEELELTEHVRLLGFVSDQQLSLAYRAADFSIVPTVALEGFGLIVVESLAAGTPVLGTPVGGIPEILRPFSEELVLEGSTTDQLAQGILEAFSGVRKLPSSKDCEAYVRAHYAWPVIARQIKSIYQSALDEKTS